MNRPKKVAAQRERKLSQAEISRIRDVLKAVGKRVSLAAKIEVSESRISEYLAGNRSPTSEGWVALGKLALELKLPDPLYYWEKAGVDSQSLRQMADKVREKQFEFVGPTVPILRLRLTEEGRKEASPPIQVPKEWLPNPHATVCLCVDEHSAGVAEVPDGLYILDESIDGTEDLASCEARIVMVRYTPPQRTAWVGGLYVGRVRLRPYSWQPLRIDARLMPLVPDFYLSDSAIPLYLGRCESKEAMAGVPPGEWNAANQRLGEMWKAGSLTFQIENGIRIIGKVRAQSWTDREPSPPLLGMWL